MTASLCRTGALLLASFAALSACGDGVVENPHAHPNDLNPPNYDPATFGEDLALINDADFENFEAVMVESKWQAFFAISPYGTRSFLESYSSNGVTVINGLLNAATKYRINPLVLLVRLQMEQGIISETEYPSDSRRVEFAFQCGCNGQGTCLPQYAGLDKQFECVAAWLRRHYDDLTIYQSTLADWTLAEARRTVDGVDVLPPNKATAALYQYDPVFGAKSQSGGWLFSRIYSLYRTRVRYVPSDELADGETQLGAGHFTPTLEPASRQR